MISWSLIYSLTFFLISGAKTELPGDLKRCSYGDSVCITKIIQNLIKEKHQGDNSLNLIKIDPLDIKKLSLKQGAESPVNIDLTFTNNQIHGLSKAKVIKVKGFGKDMTQKHEFTLSAERLDLVGDYVIKGKVLILPITGTGKSNLTMASVNINTRFVGKPVEKDGRTYMKSDKMQLQIELGRITFNFEHLFNGDKALSDNMNLFLNENWADIYKEVRDSISSEFAKVFQNIVDQVFAKYPYDKFFEEQV